jgi:hypothetical protein
VTEDAKAKATGKKRKVIYGTELINWFASCNRDWRSLKRSPPRSCRRFYSDLKIRNYERRSCSSPPSQKL